MSIGSKRSLIPSTWDDETLAYAVKEFKIALPDLESLYDVSSINAKVAKSIAAFQKERRIVDNVPEPIKELGVDGRFYGSYLASTKGRREVVKDYSDRREALARRYKADLARLENSEAIALQPYVLTGDMLIFDEALSIRKEDLSPSQSFDIAKKSQTLNEDELSLYIRGVLQAEKKRRLEERGFRGNAEGHSGAYAASE